MRPSTNADGTCTVTPSPTEFLDRMTPDPTTSDSAPPAADAPLPSLHDHLRETVRETERRRFQAITDNAMDLLAVIDADGTYTFVSGAYESILGNRPDGLLGTNCFAH